MPAAATSYLDLLLQRVEELDPALGRNACSDDDRADMPDEALRLLFTASSSMLEWTRLGDRHSGLRLFDRRRAVVAHVRADLEGGAYKVSGINTRTGRTEPVDPGVFRSADLELDAGLNELRIGDRYRLTASSFESTTSATAVTPRNVVRAGQRPRGPPTAARDRVAVATRVGIAAGTYTLADLFDGKKWSEAALCREFRAPGSKSDPHRDTVKAALEMLRGQDESALIRAN